ncbi:MAG TPA: YafY family protein [Terracidiphilus sp.]|nr:YafY family protein [Terracidiphilus sp.]
MRRADRLFQIVQRLRARRLTTARQLAQALGVSERTVYRDVRDLSISGVPIQGEAGVGYSLHPSFDLAALMFTSDEVEAIVVGLRMASAFAGPKLRAATSTALDKVVLALPKARRAEVERPQIYVPPVYRSLDTVFEALRSAIDDHAVLSLDYTDERSSATRRSIRPLALHFWGSVWTLAAWCELRTGFRSFRLDRIQECSRTGVVFADEPGKTLADFLRSVGSEARRGLGPE